MRAAGRKTSSGTGRRTTSFGPTFRCTVRTARADLYFNTIIGLVYRLYDYERLRPLFNTFQSQTSGAFYTDLFWLGLEGVAFRRTVGERPCWRTCGGSTPSR